MINEEVPKDYSIFSQSLQAAFEAGRKAEREFILELLTEPTLTMTYSLEVIKERIRNAERG